MWESESDHECLGVGAWGSVYGSVSIGRILSVWSVCVCGGGRGTECNSMGVRVKGYVWVGWLHNALRHISNFSAIQSDIMYIDLKD